VGDSVAIDGYCLEYEAPTSRVEPNRRVDGARLLLLSDDCSNQIAVMEPVFNQYTRPPAVATPAVHTGLYEDVFIALAAVPGETVVVDVYVFPLMWVLWLGGLIAVAGGLWGVATRKRVRSTVTPDRTVLEDA
jgi:cytochrome c biogenesis factor